THDLQGPSSMLFQPRTLVPSNFSTTPLPLMRVTPSTLSSTHNVIARIECLDGTSIQPDQHIQIGSLRLTDYWVDSKGRAYFIPPKVTSIGTPEYGEVDRFRYSLESPLSTAVTAESIISSITEQLDLLQEAADEKKNMGGTYSQYWRSQIYFEGYHRLEKALIDVESFQLSDSDQQVLQAWLEAKIK
ncbi:hypothetical protein, partial [Pseudomonas aeruginosa]